MLGRKDNGRLEAEKQALAVPVHSVACERWTRREKAGLITATRMRPVNHCCGWYSSMCWLEHSLSHKRSLFLSLSVFFFKIMSSCRQGGGMGRWKCWMRDKTSEGKRDLLGIHLSLWINKGNLGWFLPVGLLADRRGEGSATAELQGARIT